MLKVEPTHITMIGECEIKSDKCQAKTPAPIMAVLTREHKQINVCGACLREQVKRSKWEVEGTRIASAG